MGRLENRIALITGATDRIGRAVALAFAREGADIVLHHGMPQSRAEANGLAMEIERLGRRVVAIQADITHADGAFTLVQGAVAGFERVDILVNNAGLWPTAPLDETSVELFDGVMVTNVRSVYLMTRMVLPLMYAQNYGRIVTTIPDMVSTGAPEGTLCQLRRSGDIAPVPIRRFRRRYLEFLAPAGGWPAACRPRRCRPCLSVSGLGGCPPCDRAVHRLLQQRGNVLELFPFKRPHLQGCMAPPFRGRSSAAPAKSLVRSDPDRAEKALEGDWKPSGSGYVLTCWHGSGHLATTRRGRRGRSRIQRSSRTRVMPPSRCPFIGPLASHLRA